MTVPGQENAEYRPLKSPEKQTEKIPQISSREQSDIAAEELRASLKELGREPDNATSPPETDFDAQMQEIENRGGAIIQEASALQGELQDLTKKAEALKIEGLKNRERVATYLGNLTKELSPNNQHTNSISATLEKLPQYLTETDAEKILERARWDAAKSGLSQGDFDTMSPAEQAVVRERVEKMKSNPIPKIEKSEPQESISVPPEKQTQVPPPIPHSAIPPLPEASRKKVPPVIPESRVQPPIKPVPSVKKATSVPASVPPPVFAHHGNVQMVEFGGWGEDKNPEPIPEKAQAVVTPTAPSEIAETPEEDVPVSAPENNPSPERRKILGDSVPILKSFGTNKILKDKTPKGDFVAISERGTIYIGKDIGGREELGGVKNITRHDIEIRLDNEGYIQSAESIKNGFQDIPKDVLREYVGYLNSMGVDCRMK